MSLMVERVARAIAAADQKDYMEDCERYDRHARAAIEAMRAPTEAMVDAGLGDQERIHPHLVYRAMIDAALK
jgi:isocitrate lyase